jgi:hypothetical protein
MTRRVVMGFDQALAVGEDRGLAFAHPVGRQAAL